MDIIPKINKKAVCISTDKSSDLAALVSSYFIEEGTYFPVFNFLYVKEFQKECVDHTEDNFFGHILGNEASVYINNLIIQIKPDFIIFAGLNDEQKSYFANFSKERIIHIDSPRDIDLHPDIFSSKASVYEKIIPNRNNIVVIEDKGDLSTVIAENLAYAMKADILRVKETDDYLSNRVAKYIHEWKNRGKYASYIKIENLVKERVGDVDFSKYNIATFFTNGLPYGLVLDNPIPFCYVRKRMRDDIIVLNSIIYSQKSFGTAISFAIEEFICSEPKIVCDILKRQGYFPIELLASRATAFNFENYAAYLPYDILHICSHGSIKTSGYHIKQDFKDRDNNRHTIEYYEVPTFMGLPLDDSGNIVVCSKDIFLKFDGSTWMSEELRSKKIPNYVFNDMWTNITKRRNDKKIQRRLVNNSIIDSAIVMCADGPHQGQLQCVAGQHSPIVFNNSCWSWSEISTFFLAGGAKAYVGTLWGIEDSIATEGAIKFYEDVLEKEKTIVRSIWEVNKSVSIAQIGQENIFFVWALPFTRMKQVTEDDFNNFIDDITSQLKSLIFKVTTHKDAVVKRNTENIIKFILWVIHKEFGFNIIDVAKEDAMKNFGYDLESHTSILERSAFR